MGGMVYHGKVKQVWPTEDPDIIESRLHVIDQTATLCVEMLERLTGKAF